MNTAICPVSAQHISRATLAELLGNDGPAYEALGAGVSAALECLTIARQFYALPQELEPELHQFAVHLHEALASLERAKRQVGA
jgi:hypothetical protein